MDSNQISHNVVDLRTNGLICDNENCDWKDTSITFEEFNNWVKAPCPKCGQEVLSVQDFKNTVIAHTVVHIFNSMTVDQLESFGITGNTVGDRISKQLIFKDGKIQTVHDKEL